MRKLFVSFVVGLGLLLAGVSPVWAQAAGQPVTHTGQHFDAAVGVQAVAAPAVNTQNTLTIPAQSSKYIYITSIQLGACQDAVGGAISNVNFTTTNLNGLVWQVSQASAVNTCITPPIVLLFPNGLKSAQPGLAATIVSPAAATHTAFPMYVTYYYDF